MIDLLKPECEKAVINYWNFNEENDAELAELLKLIIKVIPISYIFRCKDYNAQIRLIIVSDQTEYQEATKTKAILDFFKTNNSNIHMLHICYGTIIDYLKRGHLFYSLNSILSNCIYKKAGLVDLPDCSFDRKTQLKENAINIFNLEIEKISGFYYGADLFFKNENFRMSTFMLHQTCEQLYRLIILILRGKDFKSHQLHLLRKEAAFYYPQMRNIFHLKESKELKWINLLQDSYLGTRYKNNYSIRAKDCIFIKEKIEFCMLKIKSEPFDFFACR